MARAGSGSSIDPSDRRPLVIEAAQVGIAARLEHAAAAVVAGPRADFPFALVDDHRAGALVEPVGLQIGLVALCRETLAAEVDALEQLESGTRGAIDWRAAGEAHRRDAPAHRRLQTPILSGRQHPALTVEKRVGADLPLAGFDHDRCRVV